MRQQRFLLAIYDRECAAAGYYQSQKAMFDPLKKGVEWRWIPHNLEGGLCVDLRTRWGYEDQGIGSTYSALVARGHIERKFTIEQGPLGPFEVTWVKLTPRGRKLVTRCREPQPAKPAKDDWKAEMVEEINALLETPDLFEQWLETFAADAYVGDAWSPTPIARFLTAQEVSVRQVDLGPKSFVVGTDWNRSLHRDGIRRMQEHPLPRWAVRFTEKCLLLVGEGTTLGDLVRARYPTLGLREMTALINDDEVSPTGLSRMINHKPLSAEFVTAVCAWLEVDPAPYTTRFNDYTSLTCAQALQVLKEIQEDHDTDDTDDTA